MPAVTEFTDAAVVAAARVDPRVEIAMATSRDLLRIAELRHAIYAVELGQRPVNQQGVLGDPLDPHISTIVARVDDAVAGFISITPPYAPSYSVDKYFTSEELDGYIDGNTFEVRLLSVVDAYRGSFLASLLIYSAARYVQSRGGSTIIVIGREELLPMYERIGLRPAGLRAQSGAVRYEFMSARVDELSVRTGEFAHLISRMEKRVAWNLDFPYQRPSPCFHGGSFFKAVGEDFASLNRREEIINADVLDAWFPPAPGVLDALQAHLPWLVRTSPPTDCAGFIDAVAAARGVHPRNILPGAGSSDLLFRALPVFAHRTARVLLLDPTYGEYAHILERVIGCRVDRFPLQRSDAYAVDFDLLQAYARRVYDVIVIVNPNSPTGRCADVSSLRNLIRAASPRTTFWIDETYVDYVGAAASLETFAATADNVFVCKSMSKVYALSGVRVAYLCAAPQRLEYLRSITPPWVVSLVAQVAAVRALEDPQYYAERYRQTHLGRAALHAALTRMSCEVVPGSANFLLCHLPQSGPSAAAVVEYCARNGVYIRDAQKMGKSLGTHAVRLAVKDEQANRRILAVMQSAFDNS